MMAVYSHVRRKALDEAAKALEPDVTAEPPLPETAEPALTDLGVTSHLTSHRRRSRRTVVEFVRKSGSSGWTRAESDEPKASRSKPRDSPWKPTAAGGWLAALDDFRNWLISEAA